MKENKGTVLAEKIYRDIVFSEQDISYWVSPRSIEGLFQLVYKAYKDIESLCKYNPRLSSTVLAYARSEIANLIHDYGHCVRGKEIGIIDRLELAVELSSL